MSEDGKVYRIIVTGSRNFNDYVRLKYELYQVFKRLDNAPIIVSGTARGTDKLGEQFADEHDLEVKRFPADWDEHGKKAGYLRNKEMAEYADVLIAFWDGKSKGTGHMIKIANKQELPTKIINIQ